MRTALIPDFEAATGYAPDLLADRAAQELRGLLRLNSYNDAMPRIVDAVAARAERVWRAQPQWRKKWTAAGKRGDSGPLMMFFRHWTAAEAKKRGFTLPHAVERGFGLGLPPGRTVLCDFPPECPTGANRG